MWTSNPQIHLPIAVQTVVIVVLYCSMYMYIANSWQCYTYLHVNFGECSWFLVTLCVCVWSHQFVYDVHYVCQQKSLLLCVVLGLRLKLSLNSAFSSVKMLSVFLAEFKCLLWGLLRLANLYRQSNSCFSKQDVDAPRPWNISLRALTAHHTL